MHEHHRQTEPDVWRQTDATDQQEDLATVCPKPLVTDGPLTPPATIPRMLPPEQSSPSAGWLPDLSGLGELPLFGCLGLMGLFLLLSLFPYYLVCLRDLLETLDCET